MVDHRGLDRVHFACGAGNTFDGAHRFSVKLWQKQNAGVVRTTAVGIRDHDTARSAIAFVTTFFGSGKSAGLAQPI